MPDIRLRDWVRRSVVSLGTQKDAARKTGIPYATLQRMMAGSSPLRAERLVKIGEAAGAEAQAELQSMLGGAIDLILSSEQRAELHGAVASSARADAQPPMVALPALSARAAAGDGSLMWGDELGRAPFQFAEDWLRTKFGNFAALRLVQVSGDSQYPDLSDGDWVVIDTDKTKFENGLSVVRLDDCLMIKRIQREGNFLQLISRNPIYGPIVIDLSKEADRVQFIGKSVFSFKAI